MRRVRQALQTHPRQARHVRPYGVQRNGATPRLRPMGKAAMRPQQKGKATARILVRLHSPICTPREPCSSISATASIHSNVPAAATLIAAASDQSSRPTTRTTTSGSQSPWLPNPSRIKKSLICFKSTIQDSDQRATAWLKHLPSPTPPEQLW